MKKKHVVLSASILGLSGIWCYYRDKKYPLTKGYRLINKFVMPGKLLTPSTAKIANQMIALEKPFEPPQDIKKKVVFVSTKDETTIPLSIYRMKETMNTSLPCLIYFHGGGFYLKDEAYLHETVCEYAREAKCMVVFVHYRTSDEHPYPTPFDDCCCAISYIWKHVDSLHILPSSIALGGDSAGGALSASCAFWCRDEANIPLCFQMLLYPVTDMRMETESMKRYVDSPVWNATLTKQMWKLYLQDADLSIHPEYASPMAASDFSNLPPMYLETAEFDCLHDEGLMFAISLMEAGVHVQYEDVKKGIHAFDAYDTPITKKMKAKRIQALHRAFYEC